MVDQVGAYCSGAVVYAYPSVASALQRVTGMNRSCLALILINLAVFIVTAALLPRAAVFSYTDPVSHVINSRNHWEIALFVTLASILITSGALLLKTRGTRSHHPMR